MRPKIDASTKMPKAAVNIYATYYGASVDTAMNEIQKLTFTSIFRDKSTYFNSVRAYPCNMSLRGIHVEPFILSEIACGSENISVLPGGAYKVVDRWSVLPVAVFNCGDRLDWRDTVDARLFLPYVGFTEVDMAWFRDRLYVDYLIDWLTGDLKVYLTVGNIIEEGDTVKIVSGNFGTKVDTVLTNAAEEERKALVTAISGIISTAANGFAGNIPGVITSTVATTAGIASGYQVGMSRGDIGGGLDGNTVDQQAFLLIFRSAPAVNPEDETYRSLNGLPYGGVERVSDMIGYTEFGKIHLDGIGRIFSGEREELESLMMSGVIL